MSTIELPGAKYGIVVERLSGDQIQVEECFEVSQQVIMGPVIWILPDLIRVALCKTFQPCIFLVITLNQLCVGRLSHRAQANSSICDCALPAERYPAKHFRQKGLLIKPIIIT